MPTASNVDVAVTGGVWYGPDGTGVPTNAVTDLDADYDEVGYLSEDGIVQSIGSESTLIKAWQNSDTVRTISTSSTVTYAFTMIETSATTLEVYYGNYTAGTVQITGAQGIRGEWIIEYHDGVKDIRIVIPDGQVTERGDTQFKNGEAVGYPITVTAYPDGSSVNAYRYQDATTSS